MTFPKKNMLFIRFFMHFIDYIIYSNKFFLQIYSMLEPHHEDVITTKKKRANPRGKPVFVK